MAANTKEIIEKVNAAFEENKPEVFLDLCSDDIKWEIAGDDVRTGKESIREFMASMAADMEPPKINVTAIISDGDSAVCHGDMTMTVNEKGTENTYSYCDIYRFSGDKITELNSFVVKQKAEGDSDKVA